jgi:exopolysaccharide biosynthesis polyprenyl glycosylphosphotransferase
MPASTETFGRSGGRTSSRLVLVLGREQLPAGAVGISALVVWLGGRLVVADGQVSREQIVVLWLGLTLALMFGRVLVRAIARRTAPRERCLIVGDGVALERFRVTLRDAGDRGIDLVGHVPPHDLIDAAADETALGLLEDLPALVRSHRVDRVLVLEGTVGHESTLELLRLAAHLRLPVDLLSRFPNITDRPLAWHYRHGVALDSDGELVLTKTAAGLKRGIDILVAAAGLVLVAPILLLAAIATRIESPGPIVFRQERVGRRGRTFELLKTRSMRVAEPGGNSPFVLADGVAPGGVEGDDRRTRVGRILRRTCIDELPQLYNVLRGDMSLVGPRPERPAYVDTFSELLSGYDRRHRLRPGLTGLAQIQGLRGQTSLSARLQTDNAYVDHWSITADLKILLLTPHAVLRARTTV